MGQSRIDDRLVFEKTTTSAPNDKGLVVMEYILPSGRVCQSPPIRQDALNGRWWISWANDIRAQDSADISNKAAEDSAKAIARRKTPSSSLDVLMASDAPASPNKDVSSSTSSSELPDDPEEMIRAKVASLDKELFDLMDLLKEQRLHMTTLIANRNKWGAIAAQLKIDLTPVSKSVEPPSTTEPVDKVDTTPGPTTEARVPSPLELQPTLPPEPSKDTVVAPASEVTEKTTTEKPKKRRRTPRKPRARGKDGKYVARKTRGKPLPAFEDLAEKATTVRNPGAKP